MALPLTPLANVNFILSMVYIHNLRFLCITSMDSHALIWVCLGN